MVKRPDNVVLFSYLPSCEHCGRFNSTFLQVAKECEEKECGIKFVLLDASKNEHDLFETTNEFPQVVSMPIYFPSLLSFTSEVLDSQLTMLQVHLLKAHEKDNPIKFDDFDNGVRSVVLLSVFDPFTNLS